MIHIPGGQFVDGSLAQTHTITEFCMDRTEITVSSYGACVASGRCAAPKVGDSCNYGNPQRQDHPMQCLDWTSADNYCEWAGKSLPDEWQWEWAARGRSEGRKFPWGDAAPTCERVIMMEKGRTGCENFSTWPVGSRPEGRSLDGLMDMAGNVEEWTRSKLQPDSPRMVIRGGGYYEPEAERFTSFVRQSDAPSFTLYGARCAKPVSTSE